MHARVAIVLAVAAGIGACTYGFDIGNGFPGERGGDDAGGSADVSTDRTAVKASCDPGCACGAGQACSLACGDDPCTPVCAANSVCTIACGDTCSTTCAAGAVCTIDCAPGSVCAVECQGTCTIACRGDATCNCNGPGCPR